MRFGTVDGFLALTPDELRLGRNVANHEFIRALLQHGTFDEYHFFFPDLAYLDAFRQRLGLVLPDPYLRSRVRPGLLLGLKETLADLDFTVFHHSDFTKNLPYMASFRDRYARSATPVTGITHSLNTALMPLRYLQLGLAPLRPSDAIICTSQAGRTAVQQSFDLMAGRLETLQGLRLSLPARLPHIPLGIDDARFDIPTRADARSTLGLHPTQPHLLYLGRLSARTKLDLHPLLLALADARKAGRLDSLTLVLAGGAEAAELNALRASVAALGLTVRWFTDFEERLKVSLLAACELFISPSDNLQETFGLSVIEAMAAGCVPLVSDFDGYRELVEHERTGILLPTCWTAAPAFLADLDPFLPLHHPFYLGQSFAIALDVAVGWIERLIGQETLLTRISQEAQRSAQQYRWSRIIPRFEALWKTLKQEAVAHPWHPETRPHPLFSDNGQSFAHYPSTRLDATSLLVLSPAGLRRRARGQLPEPGQDIRLLLSTELLETLLGRLEADAQTVAQLEAELVGPELPADILRYHLTWLLKYGWVALQMPSS